MIVFVCEHGAAKSVLAAAHFNRLAHEKSLSLHAIARGTHPDAELSAKTVSGLQEDGLTPEEPVPRKLTGENLESTKRIVTFCDLPDDYYQKSNVERWDNIPAIDEDYQKARDAIVARLETLIQHL